ncbi:unnamed protein product [Clonostachys rosea f. rosea IK726]|uniref:Uncharacterized protein n=1 Tax=Clonostachys rosea f. rosea IK726 TaxID=1349383 RepID=A0ACA9TX46_BIOOC|nr:unnamed protein product [Clonostachys rosea f. rosea IK726]
MLMSWGGEEAAKGGMDAAELRAQWHRSSQQVRAHGVDHCDEHGANLLWNAERRRVIMIDFDQAILRPALKHRQLSAVHGTKRKYRVDNLKAHFRKRSLLHNRPQAYLMSSRAPSIAMKLPSLVKSNLEDYSGVRDREEQ